MKRLRVIDWNTPLFWFTIFYRPEIYGDSWLTIELWHPHIEKWWLHCWMWEDTPDSRHAYTSEPLTERDQKL